MYITREVNAPHKLSYISPSARLYINPLQTFGILEHPSFQLLSILGVWATDVTAGVPHLTISHLAEGDVPGERELSGLPSADSCQFLWCPNSITWPMLSYLKFKCCEHPLWLMSCTSTRVFVSSLKVEYTKKSKYKIIFCQCWNRFSSTRGQYWREDVCPPEAFWRFASTPSSSRNQEIKWSTPVLCSL